MKRSAPNLSKAINQTKIMTTKEAIRHAEKEIENTLDELEEEFNVRAYSIRITSRRGDMSEVMITEDAKGGRYE